MHKKTFAICALIVALITGACSSTSEARTPTSSITASSISSKNSVATSSMSTAHASTPLIAHPVPPEHVKIPILVYHHVRKQQGWAKSTWSWKMTVSPAVFEKQMAWIKDHNYTPITLDMLVEIRQGVIASPEKPIVVTFDDNNLNAYEVGVPIMEKYGITATFYQIANRLKNTQTIDADRTKDLIARGFDVQSHTVSHATLTALSPEKLKNEMVESKRVLEELTGKPVLHICYPSTSQNQRVRDAAKAAGYVTGTIMDPRVSTEKDDLMKLPRIMMTDDTNLAKTLP